MPNTNSLNDNVREIFDKNINKIIEYYTPCMICDIDETECHKCQTQKVLIPLISKVYFDGLKDAFNIINQKNYPYEKK
jgi:hypothetical protein